MKTISLHVILFLMLVFPLIVRAYPHWSPYYYCGGDPVNCIDPTGEDIVVLNFTEGQHMAMLIQADDGKWQYYSINGNNIVNPLTKAHIGGRPFNDVAVGSWSSPQDFLNSGYNVRNENSKNDASVNHFGFSEGYQISTNPAQDAIMRNEFSKIANTEYNLFNNNCTTAVQQVMIEAGIPVSEPTMVPSSIPLSTPFGIIDVVNGYQMRCDINIIPKIAFQSIMKYNPDGELLHR